MIARRWCAALVIGVFGMSCAIAAQQQIPPNIEAGVFARDVMSLLGRSETFRSQCDRLARSPRVQVRIGIVLSLHSGRAQTAIQRLPSGAITADVLVVFGEDYRELLAHEFEHILEQVEGVNLQHEAAEGRAWVLPGGAFETRRALATGAQVVRETEPLHAHAHARATAVHATR
jgi:hypothetical protein